MTLYNQTIENTPDFSFEGQQHLCRLIDVYDGDTMTVIFEVHGKFSQFRVRLFGINTSEIRTLDSIEKDNGLLARQRAIELTCPGIKSITVESSRKEIQEYFMNNVVYVWLKCHHFCKYGRLLGEIYIDNFLTESVNNILLKEKYAEKYE